MTKTGVSAGPFGHGMPRLAARLAGRAAADKLMSLMTAGHWEAVRRAVRLQAVAVCPNVAEHPEVENYCVRPLASDLLSSAIQEELAVAISGYVLLVTERPLDRPPSRSAATARPPQLRTAH
jgi:hypothetical protein